MARRECLHGARGSASTKFSDLKKSHANFEFIKLTKYNYYLAFIQLSLRLSFIRCFILFEVYLTH